MRKILYHKNFIKNYRKRIFPKKELVEEFQKRLEIFIKDPKNLSLKDHKLLGKKRAFRAFSITGDIRVVYKNVEEGVLLFDVGSHNQVY